MEFDLCNAQYSKLANIILNYVRTHEEYRRDFERRYFEEYGVPYKWDIPEERNKVKKGGKEREACTSSK